MSGDALALAALLWCCAWSAVLFIMMGADKRRARRNARRISERRLFAVAAVGGAVGGWLGMRAFRHKTRHWYFRVGFAALAVIQLAAVFCVWRVL